MTDESQIQFKRVYCYSGVGMVKSRQFFKVRSELITMRNRLKAEDCHFSHNKDQLYIWIFKDVEYFLKFCGR